MEILRHFQFGQPESSPPTERQVLTIESNSLPGARAHHAAKGPQGRCLGQRPPFVPLRSIHASHKSTALLLRVTDGRTY